MNNILDYLEMTAQKTSWKTGVDDGNICMSWKKVMELSQRIGTVFARRTVPGKPIAIMMEKSAVTLAAMFGAVYAGCFYTVIDPSQPKTRVRKTMQILSPEVILADKEVKALTHTEECSGKVVTLKECLQAEPDRNLLDTIRRITRESDLLYCLFTSGSTGSPKGIAVTHKAVIDFIAHFTETFGITEQERIGNQAPFDFDVSVKDIYSCVFTGAALVLIPQTLFSTPPRLLDYLCEKHVSTLIWAVSALTLISSLKGLEYRTPQTVKKIMFSGEVMPARQLRLWQRALPDAEFINLYGPTEITCNCTFYRIDREYKDDEKIPIGRPFPGRQVFLMDEKGEIICEKEITGEICVSGESLSEGYFHAPEETAKRFREGSDGRRFYMTGDLGCRGADGELYFAGRKDFQIKIMGRRIELEEMEFLLSQMQGVERACCMLDKGRRQIVAYYSGTADHKELRGRLREQLPVYMIPRKMIHMEQLPLNKNGKTDRSQLKLPGGTEI